MPTRIIQGSNAPDAGGGSTWGMIGEGAQGLAALVGSAMNAQAADKAAKAAAGQKMLDDVGYKMPGTGDLMTNNNGIAANPFAGGAGSGNLGVATLPSARPIEGMVQPSSPNSLSVGPSSVPPNLMGSLQFNNPAGDWRYGQNPWEIGGSQSRFPMLERTQYSTPITSDLMDKFGGQYRYGGL